MLFQPDNTLEDAELVSREDPTNPLASFSKHSFELDGMLWPSAEHYYQAMKFDDSGYRERIRNASHPALAKKLGGALFKRKRKGWKGLRTTLMTRAIYTKCHTHPEIADALLATGDRRIVETSQYDYFWGCGRDLRGGNHYGQVLENVRAKLRDERRDQSSDS